MKKIRLLEIELEGYELLHISGIQRIKINFKERFHWILGMNGSGKSSIIKECSPLPFDAVRFQEGGFKRTVWSVDDQTYELRSHKNAKRNTHSFVLVHPNGHREELNTGWTSTVYNSLVSQIFGVTKESHHVAIGKLRFTAMDGAARKTMFTNLSAVDYTYALAYFKRLFKSYRDVLGSINIDKERLVELSSLASTKADEEKMVGEIKDLRLQMASLIDYRAKTNMSESEAKAAIKTCQTNINHLFNKMRSHSTANKHLYPLGDIEHLRASLIRLQTTFDMNEAVVDEKYTLYNEKLSQQAELTKNGSSDLKLLEADRELILKELEQTSFKLLKSKVDVDVADSEVNMALAEVYSVIESMQPIDPEELDLERSLNVRIVQLNDEIYELHTKLGRAQTDINNLDAHKHDPNVSCPKCEFSFNPRFDLGSRERLQVVYDELKVKLEKLQEVLDETNASLTKINRAHLGLNIFYNFIRRFPTLTDAWSKVITAKDHYLDPHQLAQALTELRMDITVALGRKVVYQKLEEVNKRIDWSRKVSMDDVAKLESDVKGLHKALEKLYERRSMDLDTLRHIKSKISLATFLKDSAETAQRLKTELVTLIEEDYNHLERNAFSNYILKLDAEITQREEKLRGLSSKNNEIIRLENMIRESEGKAKALKEALRVLSPTEGMIAKGLTGFINHFTGLMNNIVERIMSYEMRIIPLVPSNEDFELDYKFPMKIADSKADDPSDCSKGQCEIIDLAFRIVYAHFARLAAGPLHLDEFGSNLDHGHRQKAFDAVRRMLDITNFSQIFMVSHMSSTYNLMDGAGITVLCPDNVDIPEGVVHNETTEIIRT